MKLENFRKAESLKSQIDKVVGNGKAAISLQQKAKSENHLVVFFGGNDNRNDDIRICIDDYETMIEILRVIEVNCRRKEFNLVKEFESLE